MKKFWFRSDSLSGLSGNERIGVSTSETPTAEKSVDIEYEFGEQYHADGDHSNLIIPDNDSYKVIYKDYIGVWETGLSMANATKISAFLWDNSDSNPFAGMSPLCESAAAEIYEAESDTS